MGTTTRTTGRLPAPKRGPPRKKNERGSMSPFTVPLLVLAALTSCAHAQHLKYAPRDNIFARNNLFSSSAHELIARSNDAVTKNATCFARLGFNLVTPSDSAYADDAQPFNLRFDTAPSAIAYPTTAQEVAEAVLCASSIGLAVSARSGGHSYAAYGLGGENGSLVIDMSAFDTVSVEPESGVATIGAGNRLGEIILGLTSAGRAMPHGVCPYVGIGGHAAFGGFGPQSRLMALTLDRALSYDVVLANGTIINGLTNSTHPDLYWALAGAAPSFAIVTSTKFATFPEPASAVNYDYSWAAGELDADAHTALFGAYQDFGASQAPAELGLFYTIGPGLSLDITGVFYGPAADFDGVMAPLVNQFKTLAPGATYSSTIDNYTYYESAVALANGQPLNTSSKPDHSDTFFAKSLMTPKLTQASRSAFFSFLSDHATDLNWFVETNRDALLTFQLYASSPTYGPPYPDTGFAFVDGMTAAIVDNMGSGYTEQAYPNYVDPTLSEEEWIEYYWAPNYERLQSIKSAYDPQNVFRDPQSIRPLSSSSSSSSSSSVAANATLVSSSAEAKSTGTSSAPTVTEDGVAAAAVTGESTDNGSGAQSLQPSLIVLLATLLFAW